ncbi:hypothetical protein TeGR_g1926, partial [Tetraparma gracilis]
MTAVTADHGWDFRGCTEGLPVVDSSEGVLGATLMNGAACSAEGVTFDGTNDYVDIEPWEWGGAVTIEVIAFLRTWHDEELDQDAISALFLERDVVWCPVGRYSPTGNGDCEACASGKSTNGLAATSEDTCEEC